MGGKFISTLLHLKTVKNIQFSVILKLYAKRSNTKFLEELLQMLKTGGSFKLVDQSKRAREKSKTTHYSSISLSSVESNVTGSTISQKKIQNSVPIKLLPRK